jgi:plasmid stability protein
MKTIHVRSVPDDLYKRLWQLAHANHRSLNAHVIVLLSKSVGDEEHRNQQANILNSIRSRRFKIPANAPSTLELLRDDRDR